VVQRHRRLIVGANFKEYRGILGVSDAGKSIHKELADATALVRGIHRNGANLTSRPEISTPKYFVKAWAISD